MGEQIIVWNPVPPEANRYMALNVLHIEQLALLAAERPTSITLVSSMQKGKLDKHTLLTWRIDFANVAAHRYLKITLWKGLFPYEDENKTLRRAMWEVTDSRWVAENVPQERITRQGIRHFIVASSTVVYEFAAQNWSSTFLGEYRTVREQLQQRWSADHGANDGKASQKDSLV